MFNFKYYNELFNTAVSILVIKKYFKILTIIQAIIITNILFYFLFFKF